MAKDTYTVISTMKNEGPFVLEWIAHYKALGFDNILVCTNDCEDTTRDLLRALERKGLARHHATRIWPRAGIHRSALRQSLRYEEVKKADWNFVCDVDEFLNIKVGDGSVRALVEASGPGADVISVPWRVFGPGDVRHFADAPVTQQFRLAEHAPDQRQGGGQVRQVAVLRAGKIPPRRPACADPARRLGRPHQHRGPGWQPVHGRW